MNRVERTALVYRISELQEVLDNREKERREERLRTDERIKILEKK